MGEDLGAVVGSVGAETCDMFQCVRIAHMLNENAFLTFHARRQRPFSHCP